MTVIMNLFRLNIKCMRRMEGRYKSCGLNGLDCSTDVIPIYLGDKQE